MNDRDRLRKAVEELWEVNYLLGGSEPYYKDRYLSDWRLSSNIKLVDMPFLIEEVERETREALGEIQAPGSMCARLLEDWKNAATRLDEIVAEDGGVDKYWQASEVLHSSERQLKPYVKYGVELPERNPAWQAWWEGLKSARGWEKYATEQIKALQPGAEEAEIKYWLSVQVLAEGPQGGERPEGILLERSTANIYRIPALLLAKPIWDHRQILPLAGVSDKEKETLLVLWAGGGYKHLREALRAARALES